MVYWVVWCFGVRVMVVLVGDFMVEDGDCVSVECDE